MQAQDNSGKQKLFKDSVKKAAIEEFMLKNPKLRPVIFNSEYIPCRKIDSKLYGNDFIEGEAYILRNNVKIALPIYIWNKNMVNVSLNVMNQYIETKNITSNNPEFNIGETGFNVTNIALSLSYTRRDSLFGYPVVYNFGGNGLFVSDFSDCLNSFNAVVIFTFKKTKTTVFSMGLVVVGNQSIQVPVFPLITYLYKFQPDLDFMLKLPYAMSLRKEFYKKNSVSYVNRLGGITSLYNIDYERIPGRSYSGMSEFKSGFLYERRLGKYLIIGAESGLMYTFTSEMGSDKGLWTSDSYLSNESTVDAYFNIAVSLIP